MPSTENESGVTTAIKTKIKQPSMYKCILHNDDYTPMDFVIFVLMEFFSKDLEEANAIMLAVHNKGKGLAGIYTKEIADQKADESERTARANGHPLKITVEIA